MEYRQYQVWGVLMRLYHWAFVLSMGTLAVTGLYIHSPWSLTFLEDVRRFPVAEMRMLHFEAAYVFIAATLLRVYLCFFGSKYERIWDFAPVTPRNVKGFFMALGRYLYLVDTPSRRLGHNPLAGLAYILTMAVALFQVLTGLMLLYPESGFWQGMGAWLSITQQQTRFYHHLAMWYFFLFGMLHLYILIWNENYHPEGLISSMFSGKKFHGPQEG